MELGVGLKRWLTALITGPLLILTIALGSEFSFFLLVLLVIIISLHEFYGMVFKEETRIAKWFGISVGLLPVMAIYNSSGLQSILGVLVVCTISLFIFFLFSNKPAISLINDIGKGILGILYVSVLASHIILIRGLSFGKEWVFFLLAVIFAGDTGAYYTGRALGKHKLSPTISPGKTMEGCVGGLLANVLGALAVRSLMLPHLKLSHTLILSIAMGIVGQIGDLCESMVKRAAQLKDSGKILPGHGGMLDRIDGLLFAAPLAYYYISVLLNERGQF